MPVHVCGNFKFNTLQGILENEMGYIDKPDGKNNPEKVDDREYKGAIKTVHRLDR
jgi:hypothetical protein